MEGEWSYRGGQFNGVRMVILQMWTVIEGACMIVREVIKSRENGHVTEVARLRENGHVTEVVTLIQGE